MVVIPVMDRAVGLVVAFIGFILILLAGQTTNRSIFIASLLGGFAAIAFGLYWLIF